jgi:hypothetical protein
MSLIPEMLELIGIRPAPLKIPSSRKHPRWLAVAGAIVLFGGGCAAHNEHGSGSPPSLGLSGSQAFPSTGGNSASRGKDGSAGTKDDLSCSKTGATRSCCTGGTQTCSGGQEFATWGPCVDRKGAKLNCGLTCETNEFGMCKDAGLPDGGLTCETNEFGMCKDAGLPDGGLTCKDSEFGSCDAGMPTLCTDKTINNEPEILAAYEPASGMTVHESGQIKVWINDEHAATVAPNEQIDPMTGEITLAGDRSAKAPDGYLWEPALYIAPQTAENGGTPHFPQAIKGWYSNQIPTQKGKPSSGTEILVPGMEPPPAGTALPEKFTTEDIWDVSALGLPPGTYTGEFVIHDGDRDRAVGCVTIVIVAG